ncbi:short-chain dehydrogenase/reductase SDR [Colletotrichum tamarilloi]|uniref:Short-chain dehydrogenase/reductase SDR n=1 Tax=Colletotrichum tamarilloi TaxID=1209934 RepID=A0ABQ9R7D2_9PEZI|nr:short-chain dehydrogenase/reductase SDR [Colletotrichum tamarilloi]KAK1497203.1 short-chain dehydrogenase/reductase SDR [Colletotrichum tamarilloi]
MALDALPIMVIIGGGGIGLATAHRLGAGHHILFASRSPSTISAGAESLKQAGHKVTAQQVDVTSYESVVSLAKTASSLGGTIETVVLTSALSPTMGSAEMILAVDVVGTANVIEVFGKEVEMPYGSSVVCVGSMGQHMIPPLSPDLERHLATAPRTSLLENKELHELIAGVSATAYCIAKKANSLRVQAAAASEAYAGKGVRVNLVAPGMTETKMLAAEMEGSSGAGIREMMKAHPFKRAATAEEVADAVGFVVGCRYVNGTDVLIDGGWLAKLRWGEGPIVEEMKKHMA